MSDYDRSIHHNRDAAAWARFFTETWRKIRTDPPPDEGWMLGWFANAMMAMHDTSIDGRAKPAPSAAPATGGCLACGGAKCHSALPPLGTVCEECGGGQVWHREHKCLAPKEGKP